MLERCLIVAGLVFTFACEKREATPAQREAAAEANSAEKRAEAEKKRADQAVEAAKDRQERAEAKLDRAEDRADEYDDIDLGDDRTAADENARDGWVAFTRGKDRTADRGDYTLERNEDGSITTYRRTKVVAQSPERSDAEIVQDVKARIAANDTLRALKIDAGADDRVVTLRGTVRNASDASHAVRLALGVPGVDKVVSHLSFDAVK
jgi:osmotically-inducible protein OsmY